MPPSPSKELWGHERLFSGDSPSPHSWHFHPSRGVKPPDLTNQLPPLSLLHFYSFFPFPLACSYSLSLEQVSPLKLNGAFFYPNESNCYPNGPQFSSVPRPLGSSGGHERRFSRDPLPFFSAGGPCEQFWHGQGCPLFDVVHPAFSLSTMASPTLKGALKDGFGEAVVASDMIKPCKFPSLNKEKTDFQNENELTQNKVRSVVCVSVELAS